MFIYAFIDPSSSHSYINVELVKLGCLKSKMLKVAMVVSSPMGQPLLVDRVCR